MTFTFTKARRRASAVAIGASAAALAAVAPVAQADTDACATQQPHATIALGPAAHVESAGTAYSTGDCGRFIVDITADGTVGTGHFNLGGQLAASGLDQWTTVPAASYPPAMACDQYSQALTVYRRSDTGDFLEVGSVRYRGALYFDSTYALRCQLVRVPRSGTLGLTYGTHIYFGRSWRVAFSAQFGAAHQPVRVHAWPW